MPKTRFQTLQQAELWSKYSCDDLIWQQLSEGVRIECIELFAQLIKQAARREIASKMPFGTGGQE